MASTVRSAITDQSWDSYQHTWGGNARPSSGPQEIDFNTDLMRLATGGSTRAGRDTGTA
ncbi:hypothetical protein AB0875_29580 [Micromonospora gifhornensis]|uniref:hypothetical protein n=1 Tax=Micromonospora gifhornensis TaxID=84594 RepID=UPI0034570C87